MGNDPSVQKFAWCAAARLNFNIEFDIRVTGKIFFWENWLCETLLKLLLSAMYQALKMEFSGNWIFEWMFTLNNTCTDSLSTWYVSVMRSGSHFGNLGNVWGWHTSFITISLAWVSLTQWMHVWPKIQGLWVQSQPVDLFNTKWTDKQTGEQTDRRTDRGTDRQKNKQTYRRTKKFQKNAIDGAGCIFLAYRYLW